MTRLQFPQEEPVLDVQIDRYFHNLSETPPNIEQYTHTHTHTHTHSTNTTKHEKHMNRHTLYKHHQTYITLWVHMRLLGEVIECRDGRRDQALAEACPSPSQSPVSATRRQQCEVRGREGLWLSSVRLGVGWLMILDAVSVIFVSLFLLVVESMLF